MDDERPPSLRNNKNSSYPDWGDRDTARSILCHLLGKMVRGEEPEVAQTILLVAGVQHPFVYH